MGIMRRVRDLVLGSVTTFDAEPAPRPIAEVLLEMTSRGLLPRVGRLEALSVPAVLRARNLICATSTLPLIQLDLEDNPVRLPLLEQIDPDVANVVTLAQTLEDLLFEGTSWWRVLALGSDGFPTYAQHLDHSSVSIQERTPLSPLPSGRDPRGAQIYVDGELITDPAAELIRFDSPNPGLLSAVGRCVQRAVLLDTTSALYAEHPRPLDYFTPTDGADPASDDEVQAILNDWARARRRRSTAYVPAALTYNTVDTPTPADLQLIEQQRKASLDIANATGLDPEDLGISTTSRTYQNGVDRRQDRINDTLSPYMAAIVQRLSMGDVTKRGKRVVIDLDEYLRADPKTRAEVYHYALTDGWMDEDEVRKEERRPALTPAQRARLAARQAPAPAAPAADNVVPIRSRRTALAADAADEVVFAVDHVPLASVDPERRIIEGIAVPYGPDKIAFKGGRRYRFQQGSLVPPAEMKRNKMLRDHDMAQPQGVLAHYEDTPKGMVSKYRIFDGEDGDRTLAEAAEGRRDGLSVGVDITNTEPDPLNPGVLLVSVGGATWRETSVLAVPAFDDARVTRVAAQRDKGDVPMADPVTTPAPDTGTGTATAEPEPQENALQLNADQLQRLFRNPDAVRAIMGVPQRPEGQQQGQAQFGLTDIQLTALAQGGYLTQLLGIGQPPAEQRERVNPVRPTAVTKVEEAPAYRFDSKGNLRAAKFDFSTDVIRGLRDHDAEALERAQSFAKAQFAEFSAQREEFVVQSDVAALNPNRQRPDLYVDQKDFRYPIWDTIDKGTIADATPFVLPKFNSASGLVGAHTENVEPTPGTFTATSQTITPTPVSGKVKISRETWDQGGNPQLSGLLWRQMVKAWYESLEAAAVTALEALAPTTITITTAAADSALEQSLTSQLAPLQYVRGGFSMRDFFLQVDLYKALVAAKDGNGRRLFPYIGAQNSVGTVAAFFANIEVAGLVGRPAWALAATSINSANSYLFDSGDVSGWATAPNRINIAEVEVANVYIGLFGYKAIACTDLTGVRRIAYDPV